MGLCPNGNFHLDSAEYNWDDSDQPGLWYALLKTHQEFFPNDVFDKNFPLCNETSGLIAGDQGGPWMNIDRYFNANNLLIGNYGSDLAKIPDDQPIIWSKSGKDSRTGLAVQMEWGNFGNKIWRWAFAIHKKKDWPGEDITREVEICKTRHGCYANYNNSRRELQIGCNNVTYL